MTTWWRVAKVENRELVGGALMVDNIRVLNILTLINA